MDLNKFATRITLKEGLKKSTNIAQVKEILKITLKELRQLKLEELSKLLSRIR